MNIIPYTNIILVILALAITSQKTYSSEENTVAKPSEYAVKIKKGNCSSFLKPDDFTNNNTYTITKGTTLIFEVAAKISTDIDVGVLSSEWYYSKASNGGKPVLLLGWWWWVDGKKNNAAPRQAPDQPNTPNAPPNTGKEGLFVLEQKFDTVTSPGYPSKITAVFYPVKPGRKSKPAIVEFFVNVKDTTEVPQISAVLQ